MVDLEISKARFEIINVTWKSAGFAFSLAEGQLMAPLDKIEFRIRSNQRWINYNVVGSETTDYFRRREAERTKSHDIALGTLSFTLAPHVAHEELIDELEAASEEVLPYDLSGVIADYLQYSSPHHGKRKFTCDVRVHGRLTKNVPVDPYVTSPLDLWRAVTGTSPPESLSCSYSWNFRGERVDMPLHKEDLSVPVAEIRPGGWGLEIAKRSGWFGDSGPPENIGTFWFDWEEDAPTSASQLGRKRERPR